MKTARFPSLKTLENFDFPAQPSLNKMLVNQLMRGEYIESRESIILVGQPGTGKTHPATALGIQACQMGKKVRFYMVSDLITQLLEAREEKVLKTIVPTHLCSEFCAILCEPFFADLLLFPYFCCSFFCFDIGLEEDELP